jgi:hypothetical protein
LPELGFFRKEENSEQTARSWFGDLFEIKKTECTWHINGKLCATAPHRILGVEIGFWVSRGGAVRDGGGDGVHGRCGRGCVADLWFNVGGGDLW